MSSIEEVSKKRLVLGYGPTNPLVPNSALFDQRLKPWMLAQHVPSRVHPDLVHGQASRRL
jgi:hypothetical protein